MEHERERERIDPDELARVLQHYDLGEIDSAKEFPRGSRRAAKLLLRVGDKRYLLKRRAQGRDTTEKVVFTHTLLLFLQHHKFPVAPLIMTRDRDSLLELDGRVYELFEFVDGERYHGDLDETLQAGRALARLHHVIDRCDTAWQPPVGSFHDAQGVRTGLNAIPSTTSSHDSVLGHEAELLALTQEIHERYDEAADAVNALGFAHWPVGIIHGDFHPGNLLFAGGQVVAVLDFETSRRQPRIVELANGMLQFSILRGEGDPAYWPAYFDETRMRRFLVGYTTKARVPAEQRRAIPHLMIESLVSEIAMPIAATGSFGHMPGFGVMRMAARKIHWLLDNVERMTSWLIE